MAQVYRRYDQAGRPAERWDPEAPGNRCILAERHERLRSHVGPEHRSVLEVGCGAGAVMGEVAGLGAGSDRLVGVDLLADRLGRAALDGRAVAQADGRRLPFPDASFDLVVTFTVFSSILDPSVRSAVAADIARVLRPGGAVLWYDLRFPGTNRDLRPMGRRELGRLFPGFVLDVDAVTLLPPLARRLGALDRRWYPRLTSVGLLRSHLIGRIHRA